MRSGRLCKGYTAGAPAYIGIVLHELQARHLNICPFLSPSKVSLSSPTKYRLPQKGAFLEKETTSKGGTSRKGDDLSRRPRKGTGGPEALGDSSEKHSRDLEALKTARRLSRGETRLWSSKPFWIGAHFGSCIHHPFQASYFSGWIESDVHWGYNLDFDPWPRGVHLVSWGWALRSVPKCLEGVAWRGQPRVPGWNLSSPLNFHPTPSPRTSTQATEPPTFPGPGDPETRRPGPTPPKKITG